MYFIRFEMVYLTSYFLRWKGEIIKIVNYILIIFWKKMLQ